MNPKFRLNEFRDIAKWLDKKLPAPLAYFLKGWLWGLEEAWINAKVSAAVETAIAPHRPIEEPLIEPTHYCQPSEVDGLDIIGYSYKSSESWVVETGDPSNDDST